MLRENEIRDVNIYKSPFLVSKKGFKYFLLTLIITVLGYFGSGYLSAGSISYDMVRVCTLIAVVLMIIEYINFAKYSGSYVSNYAIISEISVENIYANTQERMA